MNDNVIERDLVCPDCDRRHQDREAREDEHHAEQDPPSPPRSRLRRRHRPAHGGLQGTAQNLGSSFGTALIGAILLSGLTSATLEGVTTNPALPPETQTAIADKVAADGIDVVPVETVRAAATAAGLSPAEADAVASDYAAAQLVGLRDALGAVALVAVLGLWFTRRLPTGPPAPATSSPA